MNGITHELRGAVQLNHKTQPVDIVYNTFSSQESIKIGDDTFKLSDEGSHYFEGYRIKTERTGKDAKVLVHEKVLVNMDPESVALVAEHEDRFAAEFHLANKDEFHFTPGDNALITLTDNASHTCVANFVHLDPVPQPAQLPGTVSPRDREV